MHIKIFFILCVLICIDSNHASTIPCTLENLGNPTCQPTDDPQWWAKNLKEIRLNDDATSALLLAQKAEKFAPVHPWIRRELTEIYRMSNAKYLLARSLLFHLKMNFQNSSSVSWELSQLAANPDFDFSWNSFFSSIDTDDSLMQDLHVQNFLRDLALNVGETKWSIRFATTFLSGTNNNSSKNMTEHIPLGYLENLANRFLWQELAILIQQKEILAAYKENPRFYTIIFTMYVEGIKIISLDWKKVPFAKLDQNGKILALNALLIANIEKTSSEYSLLWSQWTQYFPTSETNLYEQIYPLTIQWNLSHQQFDKAEKHAESWLNHSLRKTSTGEVCYWQAVVAAHQLLWDKVDSLFFLASSYDHLYTQRSQEWRLFLLLDSNHHTSKNLLYGLREGLKPMVIKNESLQKIPVNSPLYPYALLEQAQLSIAQSDSSQAYSLIAPIRSLAPSFLKAALEIEFNRARDGKGNLAEYRKILVQWQQGFYSSLARERIRLLEQTKTL